MPDTTQDKPLCHLQLDDEWGASTPDCEPEIMVDPPLQTEALKAPSETASQKQPEATPHSSQDMNNPEIYHREGECIINLPDVEPEVLSAAELAGIEKQEKERAQTFIKVKSLDEEPVMDATTYRSLWQRWLVWALLISFGGIFGFYIFSQAVTTVALAQSLPTWGQILFLPPLALCGLIVLAIFTAFIWSWFKLRTFKQIDLSKLTAGLDERKKTQHQVRNCFEEAQAELFKYLQEYPLAGNQELTEARNYLACYKGSSQNWIKEFTSRFQTLLDYKAKGVLKRCALQTGVTTMVSPIPLLDAFFVLAISFNMVKELCLIYNLRVGRLALPFLLIRVIRNAFLGALAQEASEVAMEAVNNATKEAMGIGLVGKFLGRKVAEGAVNSLFLYRLGRTAQRMLKPVA